jgi:hypothetical protein
MMENIGKSLLILGAVTLIVGAIVYFAARSGLLDRIPFGRLPGDIQITSGGFTCLFPLATMIILSVVGTILLNVIIRLINRP